MAVVVESQEPQNALEGIAGALGVAPLSDKDNAPPAEPPPPAAQPDPIVPGDKAYPEKFWNKPLSAVIDSYSASEREFHKTRQENARLAYELELQRTATLTLKDQLDQFKPAPQRQQPEPWAGVDLEQDIILAPRKVLDRALSIQEQRATEITKAAADQLRKEIDQREQARNEYQAAVWAAEQAREHIGVTDVNEWTKYLRDIAPAIEREHGRAGLLDATKYVEGFQARRSLYAPPSVQMQVQGNPPVTSRPAQGASVAQPPTPVLSPRRLEQAQHFASVFGLDPDAFSKRVASQMSDKES